MRTASSLPIKFTIKAKISGAAILRLILLGSILLFLPRTILFGNDKVPPPSLDENAIVLPEPVADPIEPVNRFLWEVNRELMVGVVQPSSKGYRVVVPKPLRTGIRNVGRNMGYPRKLINNLLEERWTGARDESLRFLCNSTVGLAGLFDVASPNGIPEWEADFGQTFHIWGWKPAIYLMLPLMGPSNERDALGSFGDSAVNPITYFPPCSYIPTGITYNNLTDTVDDYVRVSKTDMDPYAVLRYAATLKRESHGIDLRASDGQPELALLETLHSVFFNFRDPRFAEHRKSRSVEIPQTRRKAYYSAWLRDEKAPVVYIVPGIGAHRLSSGAIALAELLYNAGFSAVTLSNPFNYEFIQESSSMAMPGYTPVDTRDLQLAIAAIDQRLEKERPGRMSGRALLGASLGAFQALYLAGTTSTVEPNSIHFDRYVAIDSPVRLDYGIQKLDKLFNAALEWPAAERKKRIEQTFLKVAVLSSHLDSLQDPNAKIPLNNTEAKFLIGLAFRLHLRDVIYLSQMHTNQGLLKEPLSKWRREPVYREILQYSFDDYLTKFLTPYLEGRGVELGRKEVLEKAVDLRGMSETLRNNPKVRLIANRNDIVLDEPDVDWLQKTFDDRLKLFGHGGHLGNLTDPDVQQAIVNSLADLKITRAASLNSK